MKTKYILLGFICIVWVLFTSCDSFLEEVPKSELSSAADYQTEQQCRAAVSRLYERGCTNSSWVSPGVYNGSHYMLGGFASGLFDNLNYKGQEFFIEHFQALNQNGNNIASKMDSYWNEAYVAIQNANLAIKHIPDCADPALTDVLKNKYIAEAKFFRAINYLFLVRHYGGVPLILEPYESLENLFISRTEPAQVYTAILSDLTEAASTLVMKTMADNEMRITATVAYTYLADAYLSMAGFPVNDASAYAKAAEAAKAVINSNQHTLLTNDINQGESFGLTNPGENSAYNKLRKTAYNRNKEYIHEYEFDATIRSAGFSSNSYPMEVGALGSAEVSITLTNNTYRPIRQYLSVYDSINDLRMWERQYFSNYFVKKDGSFLYNNLSNTPSPYFYLDETAMYETSTSSRSFPLKRYPEVLLIAAEGIAQSTGVTDEAAEYVAQVRARAYVNTTKEAIKAELMGLSKQAFIEQVWIERMREFPLEWKIWTDIQRTQKYPVTDAAKPGAATFVDFIGASNNWGQTFTEKDRYWPISYNELQRNPELTQNPGYE